MIEFLQQNSTLIACILIGAFAIWYFSNLIYIYIRFNSRWCKRKFGENISDIDNDRYIGEIYQNYSSTIIFLNADSELRTDIKAHDFINVSSVLRSIKINHRAMSSAPGILVGLGLLGTFLGLTLGVQQFDSSTTESIQNSISALLGGMGTAFFTSLIGMGLSTIYIVAEKTILNKFNRRIDRICDYLDKKYFISQPEKYALIYERQNKHFAEIFTTKDDNGNVITSANLLRDIYEENRKQTKALAGFTEELFFEITNNAMNESLQPLVKEVKNVTDTLSQKLEEFAEKVQSPGENLADGIVKELKESITTLLTELKQSVSSIAGDKIDELNNEMQSATAALATFPERMESMMNTLSDHFGNINHLVDKLVKDSSSVNEGNINQMQAQIENVTKIMTNTTSQIEQLIGDMSAKSLDTNNSIIQQMKEQVNYSTTNMNNLTNNIQEVMAKLSNQSEDIVMNMMVSQEQNQAVSDKTLASFASTVSGLEDLINNIKNTIGQFANLQTETNQAASHLSELSRNALSSTVTLREAQSNFISEVKDNSIKSLESIQGLESALSEAKGLPQEYILKFGTIKDALSSIFDSINSGLNQYSTTVKNNTQEFLEMYSKSLTDSVTTLSGAIDELSSIVEDLQEVNKK